jgi:DNA-binding transcriptional LysR family regulator
VLPPGCRITHRMADHFVLIAPVDFAWPAVVGKRWTKDRRERLDQASWLMPAPGMQTRQDLDAWLRKAALAPERIAVFDSFDLIIHLVALGLGIALVPRRALAPFPRKKQLKVCALPEAFERQLVVVTRARGAVSGQVKAFVEAESLEAKAQDHALSGDTMSLGAAALTGSSASAGGLSRLR